MPQPHNSRYYHHYHDKKDHDRDHHDHKDRFFNDLDRITLTCPLTDEYAEQIVKVWQQAFPDASILPVIGYPSNAKGVVTITHTMGDGKLMSINGLRSRSPLANNALYSVECVNGKFLNLYEIMIPDLPGRNGEPSTAEIYTKALFANGLDVAGTHCHWWGSHIVDGDRGVTVIHHQKIGMNPIDFTQATIRAIKTAMEAIQART